jgi:hypothetical protein
MNALFLKEQLQDVLGAVDLLNIFLGLLRTYRFVRQILCSENQNFLFCN